MNPANDSNSEKSVARPELPASAPLAPVKARPESDLLAPTPVAPAGGARGGGLRMMLRYKWTVIVIAALLAGPAVAAIWKFVQPVYAASGQIRVRPIIPHLVFTTEDSGAVPYYQNYLNTQVALVGSPTVLQRALSQPDVQATAWYRNAGRAPLIGSAGSRLEQLRSQLEVRPRPQTEIIDVILETTDGRDGAVIVNAVLEQYLRHTREVSSQESDRIYDELVRQHDTLKTRLREKEQQIEELHRQLGTTDPQVLIAAQRTRLDAMESQFDDAQRAQALAKWKLERISKNVSSPPTTAPEQRSRYQADGEWWRLKEEVARMDMSLQTQQERLGPMHPTIRDLVRRKQFAEQMVAARERLLDQGGAGVEITALFSPTPVQAAQDEVGLSGYQAQLVSDSLARQKQAWIKTFDGAEVLNQRLAELRDVRELYDAVKSRLESKRMERNVPGSIEVLARAVEPKAISKDRRMVYSALAVFGALAVALMVAGLRASSQRAMVEPAMLPVVQVGPFVGMLPEVRPGRCLPLKHPRLLERVRTVRTVLLQRIERGDGNVVMLTSAGPREGKTTISVMLARSLAQCGKRVLLVDADMHNPRVAETLGVKAPACGFLQAVAQGRAHEAVMDTAVPRLRIAPGCTGRASECDAFSDEAFAAALESWRQEYDVVLVDTAPVLSSADALILAPRVDGTVFIVRMEQTRADSMREALSYLTSVGGDVWGTVMIGHECSCGYITTGSGS